MLQQQLRTWRRVSGSLITSMWPNSTPAPWSMLTAFFEKPQRGAAGAKNKKNEKVRKLPKTRKSLSRRAASRESLCGLCGLC